MAVEFGEVEIDYISAWKIENTPRSPDTEQLGTYEDNFGGLNENVIELLTHNIVRAFNSKEKPLIGVSPSQTSFRINHRSVSQRGGTAGHAFVLDFTDENRKECLDNLLDEENIEENAEELVESYRTEKGGTRAAIFFVKISIQSVGQEFMCMFITDIGDEKFQLKDEEEIAQRIRESFDEDIPQRVVYPFYIESDDTADYESVKIWHKNRKGIPKFLCETLSLRRPYEPKDVVLEGMDGEPITSAELITDAEQTAEREGLEPDHVRDTELTLRLDGEKFDISLSKIENGEVKLLRNDDNDKIEGMLFAGEISLEDKEGENLQDLFIDREDLDDFFER